MTFLNKSALAKISTFLHSSSEVSALTQSNFGLFVVLKEHTIVATKTVEYSYLLIACVDGRVLQLTSEIHLALA